MVVLIVLSCRYTAFQICLDTRQIAKAFHEQNLYFL